MLPNPAGLCAVPYQDCLRFTCILDPTNQERGPGLCMFMVSRHLDFHRPVGQSDFALRLSQLNSGWGSVE